MSNLVIRKWWHFEHKVKREKNGLFSLGPKLEFLTYFLKDFAKKVLKIYNSIVIENFKPVLLCPIKWRPLNFFAKLHKMSSFNSQYIIKDAVSGLRFHLNKLNLLLVNQMLLILCMLIKKNV